VVVGTANTELAVERLADATVVRAVPLLAKLVEILLELLAAGRGKSFIWATVSLAVSVGEAGVAVCVAWPAEDPNDPFKSVPV
jgi:hypothetical protein